MDDAVAALCVNAGKACDRVVAEIARAHAAIANPHLRIAVVMMLSFYLSVLKWRSRILARVCCLYVVMPQGDCELFYRACAIDRRLRLSEESPESALEGVVFYTARFLSTRPVLTHRRPGLGL